MAQTQRDTAIAFANAVIAWSQTFKTQRQLLNDYVTTYNSENYGTTWGALATAPLNADGSLGAADASPVAGHPINNGLTSQSALQKAVSASQLAAGITLMMNLQKFLTNQAPTVANYNVNVDDLAS